MLSQLLKVARGPSTSITPTRVTSLRAVPILSSPSSWARGLSSFSDERRLFRAIADSQIPRLDHPQLTKFLEEKKLNGFLQKATDSKMSGVKFLSKIFELKDEFPEDCLTLEGILYSDPALKPFVEIKKKIFASCGSIGPNSGCFFVPRGLTERLKPIVCQEGGFIMVHAPFYSGLDPPTFPFPFPDLLKFSLNCLFLFSSFFDSSPQANPLS